MTRAGRTGGQARRIAIFGLSKTGTTGLYGLIRTAAARAGGDPVCAFEPRSAAAFRAFFERARPRVGFVTKAMVRPVYFEAPEVIGRFSHRVMTLRDPRDRAVSALLFRALSHRFEDTQALNAFLDLLRRKEAEPASIAFGEIFERADALRIGISDWERVWANVDLQAEVMGRHDFFAMRYEDFVERRYDGLEAYLGLPLGDGQGDNAAWLGHITRSRSQGEWRNWFTPADVATFRPIFKPFMDRFGYADDWDLPAEQTVLARNASDYVAREHAVRARQFELAARDPADPTAVEAAPEFFFGRAEDGRPTDLLRVADHFRRTGREAEAFRHYETGHILGKGKCAKPLREMLDAGFRPTQWRSRLVGRRLDARAAAGPAADAISG